MTETTITTTLLEMLETLREAASGESFLLTLKMLALLAVCGVLAYLALWLFERLVRGPGLVLLALALTVAFCVWVGEDEVNSWSGHSPGTGLHLATGEDQP